MIVEVCVGDVHSAIVAAEAGADRLELCADLSVGGTTPSLGTVRTVLRHTRTPLRVMVRPRGGDFHFATSEAEAMRTDIAALRTLDTDRIEVVTGGLTSARHLDIPLMKSLVDEAGPLPVVFHKAFDEIDDQEEGLETLVDLGVTSLLTSGGAATALEGAARLHTLAQRARGRLRLTAAGGIRAHNVAQVLRHTGIGEIHFRSPSSGSPETTDPGGVHAVLEALSPSGRTGPPHPGPRR